MKSLVAAIAILSCGIVWGDSPKSKIQPSEKIVTGVAISVGGRIDGFIFVGDKGDVDGVDGNDCADSPDCIHTVDLLQKAGRMKVIHVVVDPQT